MQYQQLENANTTLLQQNRTFREELGLTCSTDVLKYMYTYIYIYILYIYIYLLYYIHINIRHLLFLLFVLKTKIINIIDTWECGFWALRRPLNPSSRSMCTCMGMLGSRDITISLCDVHSWRVLGSYFSECSLVFFSMSYVRMLGRLTCSC